MEVLNPSNRRMTLINGHLSGYYHTHMDELLALEEENKKKAIQSRLYPADIKLGYNYRNTITNELFIVDSPKKFYELEQRILNGENFYE